MSAEEAKKELVETLKDEAKTHAMAHIQEIVEEAKLTANKDAKKIIIQTIQRVATEHAIENSVSVLILKVMMLKVELLAVKGVTFDL